MGTIQISNIKIVERDKIIGFMFHWFVVGFMFHWFVVGFMFHWFVVGFMFHWFVVGCMIAVYCSCYNCYAI